MKDKIDIKENIINVTTELIEQNDGNTKNITARLIAEKCNIGLGLINYHFGTKENLITTCVQRIIEKVIAGFDAKKEYNTDKERLISWAIYVFDFLFQHSAISKISICGDMQNYTVDCNSVFSQHGFMLALTEKYEKKDKQLLSFILTSALQTAFLSGDSAKHILGYDFSIKENRDDFIVKTVSLLFDGINKSLEIDA